MAIKDIEDETSTHFLLSWEGIDPSTGENWKPTWEPKSNANSAAKRAWKEKKKNSKVKSQPRPRALGSEEAEQDAPYKLEDLDIKPTLSPSPPPELEDSGDYFEEEEDEIARQVQEEPSDDELFDPTQTPSKRKARLAKERAQKARQQAEELRRPKVYCPDRETCLGRRSHPFKRTGPGRPSR